MFASAHDRDTGRAFIGSQKSDKLCFLQNDPFGEAPRTSSSLVFEINPSGPGIRMPKGFPEHWKIIALRLEPDDMFYTDSFGIAPLKTVGDAQRVAFAFAPPNEKALIPSAWRQLIPNEGGDAA